MLTGIYSGLLTLLYFQISLHVIRGRRRLRIPYGVGPNQEIAPAVGAHSNFLSYVPITLILLLSLELQGAFSLILLHGILILFTVGRVLHFRGMVVGGPKNDFRLRILGMHLTLWPMLALAGLNLLAAFAL